MPLWWLGGDVKTDEVKLLAEKWFGPIPPGEKYIRNLPQEPDQQEERREPLPLKCR